MATNALVFTVLGIRAAKPLFSRGLIQSPWKSLAVLPLASMVSALGPSSIISMFASPKHYRLLGGGSSADGNVPHGFSGSKIERLTERFDPDPAKTDVYT